MTISLHWGDIPCWLILGDLTRERCPAHEIAPGLSSEEATIAHLAETIENVRWAMQSALPATPVGEDVDGGIDEFATELEEMTL